MSKIDLQKHILSISRLNYSSFLKLPNVQGIGYGFKYVNNRCTYEPCLHVLVSKKVGKVNLSYDKIIPKYFMGIKTDVIENGITKSHSLQDIARPLQGGYEILAKSGLGSLGTIGCIVKKGSFINKKYYILSNNHVLTNGNLFPKKTPIIQPAYGDASIDTVAKLSDFIEIKFKTPSDTPENKVDCAIAKLTDYKNVSNKIALLGEINGIGIPNLHVKVMKVGAVTGLTKGKIITIGATLTIEYSFQRSALFIDQIITTKMSEVGDSGSLLVDPQNRVIGLLTGGSDYTTFYNDINMVLQSLKVSLL